MGIYLAYALCLCQDILNAQNNITCSVTCSMFIGPTSIYTTYLLVPGLVQTVLPCCHASYSSRHSSRTLPWTRGWIGSCKWSDQPPGDGVPLATDQTESCILDCRKGLSGNATCERLENHCKSKI